MRTLLLISWHDLKNLLKNPMWLFFALGFPICMISFLGFLTRDNYGPTFSSYDYYGITVLIVSIALNCTFSTNAFLEERIKKPNLRIIYAPCKDSFIYLAKIISSFIFCGICNIIVLLFNFFVLGVNLNGIGALLVLICLFNLFSVSFGVFACCLLKSELIANQIQSTIVNISAVFAGVWFPLEGTGEIMKTLSNLSPLKWLINVFFAIIYDNDFSKLYLAILILVALSLLTIGSCKLTYKREAFL